MLLIDKKDTTYKLIRVGAVLGVFYFISLFPALILSSILLLESAIRHVNYK